VPSRIPIPPAPRLMPEKTVIVKLRVRTDSHVFHVGRKLANFIAERTENARVVAVYGRDDPNRELLEKGWVSVDDLRALPEPE